MKKIFISSLTRNAVGFDTENQSLFDVPSDSDKISRLYYIKEDCEMTFGCEGDQQIVPLNAEDIVIVFYEDRFPHHFVVIKNKEWAENIKWLRDEEQRMKEEWAAKHADEDIHCCDDSCPNLRAVDAEIN